MSKPKPVTRPVVCAGPARWLCTIYPGVHICVIAAELDAAES